MSTTIRDDVALVRAYYDRVDSDDVDGLLALFADDAVYERPGYVPLNGRAALKRFYQDQRIIEHGRHTLDEVIAGPDRIAVSGAFAGRLKDGRNVDLRFADFFTFAPSGRFARRTTFFYTPLV
uniref:nuclear transport factor 2 family protein n=1 Tax=Herbidospora sakaeratensis TaxID=564415 RepID=UPI0007801E2F|nr:nuclear transport factor 2 family protein [Herbidospora sakaeratensis]